MVDEETGAPKSRRTSKAGLSRATSPKLGQPESTEAASTTQNAKNVPAQPAKQPAAQGKGAANASQNAGPLIVIDPNNLEIEEEKPPVPVDLKIQPPRDPENNEVLSWDVVVELRLVVSIVEGTRERFLG